MTRTLTRYDYKAGLGYKLNRAATIMNAAVEDALGPHGLSLMSWIVLSAISFNERTTVTELSKYTGIERTAVSRTASRLQEDGLLRREKSDSDARASELMLTPEGGELCQTLQSKIQLAMSSLLLDLSPNQISQLGALLDLIQPGEEPRWSDERE